ncbi:MAG: hypothetical protein JXK94_03570 [Deltaproteobacteria bacterium]|nr:hypothetical protein [Deltaproteobacteria bacterium]
MSHQKKTDNFRPVDSPAKARKVFIDAGTERLRIHCCDSERNLLQSHTLSSHNDLKAELTALGLISLSLDTDIFLTGKIRDLVRELIGKGRIVLPEAALWSAAESLAEDHPVAILEISASGYTAVGVDPAGNLHQDLFTHPPRCGSGCGLNLDRILQKLNVDRARVDTLLANYTGDMGKGRRQEIPVRTDRCGVFASSATISDKNQGLPIDYALAVTVKSEVLKACKTIPKGFKTVWLTGGVFEWAFARDCAEDFLAGKGVLNIHHDREGSLPLKGLMQLEKSLFSSFPLPQASPLFDSPSLHRLPSLPNTHSHLVANNLYHRLEQSPKTALAAENWWNKPVLMGLDVGSTMAKLVVAGADNQEVFYQGTCSNAGDTIDTIKTLLSELTQIGATSLNIAGIGITGSARFQVQQAFTHIYPQLAGRLLVLVENYAHARGSLGLVKEHIGRLKKAGLETINEDLCILVDVGGEDTKVSTIALKKGELFDNVMNTKCSAGTGSLMDTLAALFHFPDIGEATNLAWKAEKGYAINATCAVFLLENARRLEARGIPREEILASANRAIAENMARSLWNRIELPHHAVTLLHGQTMLSEPLPVAVAQRLQEHLGAPAYCLVPPNPGHRACLGLINTLAEQGLRSARSISLEEFIHQDYHKKIVPCRGTVCGDKEARCNRSHLTAVDPQGKQFGFFLGGCASINEKQSNLEKKPDQAPATYRQLWHFMADALPSSENPERLVIPRSFAISEFATFFAHLFLPLGIPVHVDNLEKEDIILGRAHFPIDTCAPFIGAMGQMLRLAKEPHGLILAPQIEFLPHSGASLGRACTVNQGGPAAARAVALKHFPQARINLFYVDLKSFDGEILAHKLHSRLQSVFRHYGLAPDLESFRQIVARAVEAQLNLKARTADKAAELVEEALAKGHQVALVLGREYVLNPGIYDSHIGRLLRDKGLAGIPGHLLEVDPAPEFKHLYWRNAHTIATLTQAAARGQLHTILRHPGLKKIFKKIESSANGPLPLVQVSTFLCGPDSVTNPLLDQLARNRPVLRIQSDAAIQELAHLENRINTYVKQLSDGLHQTLAGFNQEEFDIRVLDPLVNREPLDKEKDVICFPTLSDNRLLLSVVRGAGFTCLDNYDDDYDLQAAVARGRSVAGDSVCTPLAAVYGDILLAVKTFKRRRLAGDPQLAEKKRLLIFNNKGLGPCRQGQYVETHKIFLHQHQASSSASAQDESDEAIMQFLVGHENQGFNIGFPDWVFLRGIQSIILQGVLHQLLAEGATRCRNGDEYSQFLNDYKGLKKELGKIFEKRLPPSPKRQQWGKRFGHIPLFGWVVKFFAYRWYACDLLKPLHCFSQKWCHGPLPKNVIKIHINGEVYMRTAQFEGLHRSLLDILGFRRFHLTQAPIWSFLEYKLGGMIMRSKESIAESRKEIRLAHSDAFRHNRKRFLRKKQKRLLFVTGAHWLLRKILAAPLYRAAEIPLPHAMPDLLAEAAAVIPTRRPGGELIPYVGETLVKLREGYDLILNVAPEGCMVSAMGQVLSPAICETLPDTRGKICPLFSQQGDIDTQQVALALLKTLGPQRFYGMAAEKSD